MKNKVDRSLYPQVDAICKKTKYLRHIYSKRNGEDATLFFLDALIPENDADILVQIDLVFDQIKKECCDTDSTYSIKGRIVEFYQLHWAKLCVYAYFYYHDEPLWKQIVVPRMIQKVEFEVIRDDIETAQFKTDKYYADRDAIVNFSQQSSGTVINIYGNVGNAIANVEQLNIKKDE